MKKLGYAVDGDEIYLKGLLVLFVGLLLVVIGLVLVVGLLLLVVGPMLVVGLQLVLGGRWVGGHSQAGSHRTGTTHHTLIGPQTIPSKMRETSRIIVFARASKAATKQKVQYLVVIVHHTRG